MVNLLQRHSMDWVSVVSPPYSTASSVQCSTGAPMRMIYARKGPNILLLPAQGLDQCGPVGMRCDYLAPVHGNIAVAMLAVPAGAVLLIGFLLAGADYGRIVHPLRDGGVGAREQVGKPARRRGALVARARRTRSRFSRSQVRGLDHPPELLFKLDRIERRDKCPLALLLLDLP